MTNSKMTSDPLVPRDKRKGGKEGGGLSTSSPLLVIHMPADEASRYFIPGAFSLHTVSQMSCMVFTQSSKSTCMFPHPYPSAQYLINQIDQSGDGWYQDCADNLHLQDFVVRATLP